MDAGTGQAAQLPGLYQDWARLLGTERPPSWLIACTVDAFVEEVCRVFAADPLG